MAKKWIMLDILLLIAVFMLAQELYQQYEQFKTKIDPLKIEPVFTENQAAAKTAPGAFQEVFTEAIGSDDADYYIISEKTLFSDLRGNEEAIASVAPPVAPLPKPPPVLMGVTMIDGQYTATVRTQAAPQARGGQVPTETWRVGDFYRGYRVESIEFGQLILENSGVREILPLNRTARPPAQQAGRQMAAAPLVTIGQGGTASGALTVSTASVSAPPGRAAAASAQTAAQTAAQAAAARQQAAQQAQAQQAQPKPAQTQQQQRIPVTITTPEGEVVLSVPENLQELINVRTPAQKAPPQPNQGGRPQPQQQRNIPSPFGEIIRPGS